jgi:hypothetical protein
MNLNIGNDLKLEPCEDEDMDEENLDDEDETKLYVKI